MPEKKHKAWKKKKTNNQERSLHASPGDPEQYIMREIDMLRRAYKQGNLGAMLEALILCSDPRKMRYFRQMASNPRPLPEWLTAELLKIIKAHLCRRGTNGRSWMNQYVQDCIDYARYELVKEAREHGIPWRDINDVVSELLAGTKAEGAPGTIRESYRRVKERCAITPLRYKWLSAIPTDLRLDQKLPPKVHQRLWKWIDSIRTDSTK
jgi:hypothetical protein